MFPTTGSLLGPGALSRKYLGSGPITRLTKNSAQSVPNNTFWTSVTWDTVVQDDVGAWNPATLTPGFIGGGGGNVPNCSLRAPSGFSWVQLTCYLCWDNHTGNGRDESIQWGAVSGIGNLPLMARPLYSEIDLGRALNEAGSVFCMPWFRIVGGEVFFVTVAQNTGANLNVYATDLFGVPCWFQAEWGN